MSTLSVTGLCKGYAGTEVLRGVDLEVPAGSLTAEDRATSLGWQAPSSWSPTSGSGFRRA